MKHKCCGDQQCEHGKLPHDLDCHGNCGHNGCSCPQSSSTHQLFNPDTLEIVFVNICDLYKSVWYYRKVILSEGYTSLRLPPKISS